MKRNKRIEDFTPDTVIGETVFIEGKIISKKNLQIEGKINGEIKCDGSVKIGEKGEVNATIHAINLVIAGSVNGNVTAKEKLLIKDKGKLLGEATTKSFIVDEGGTFLGRSNMQVPIGEVNAEVAATNENNTANSTDADDNNKNFTNGQADMKDVPPKQPSDLSKALNKLVKQ